jgi:hypothetical protein
MKKKYVTFQVRLKGVGPKSKKKLMAMGLDENMSLTTATVVFTDDMGYGFDHPMFYASLMDHQDKLIKDCVECVILEGPPKCKSKSKRKK